VGAGRLVGRNRRDCRRHDLLHRREFAAGTPGKCLGRRIEKDKTRRVDFQDRQRASRHLERRQEIAHPGTLDPQTSRPHPRKGVAGDDGQFHGRCYINAFGFYTLASALAIPLILFVGRRARAR
jgi:hypothetical protein